MPLEFHSNDNAREGRPSVWIFEGKSVVFLVCGVAAFIALFRILAACDLDWPITLGISVLPLLAMAAYVHFCVNGKPPSYFVDMALLLIWRAKAGTLSVWGVGPAARIVDGSGETETPEGVLRARADRIFCGRPLMLGRSGVRQHFEPDLCGGFPGHLWF